MDARADVFREVTELIIETAAMPAKQKKKAEEETIFRVLRLGMLLSIVAGDDVLKAFEKWRLLAIKNTNQDESLESFAGLLFAMRKDLLPDTSLCVEDLMKVIGFQG